MRFKDVFAIIGPSMIGPSSSHTAGAARIGRVARQWLNAVPEKADITFYGSFAETYQGHGTDVAIVAGLLDWETDDPRIPDSLEVAADSGMAVQFHTSTGLAPHPNTAVIRLEAGGRNASLIGCSIGGGNIEIHQVNQFAVKFTAFYPTMMISHMDRPGLIAEVTNLISGAGLNIGSMANDRKSRSGEALTVIETDQPIPESLVERLKAVPQVIGVTIIDVTERRSP